MAFLIDIRDQRRSYPLVESQVVGRDPGCDIVVDDPKVSRQHMVVRSTPDGHYRAIDLNSRGGLWVGGKRTPFVDLVDGAELRLGDTRLRFRVDRRSVAVDAVKIPAEDTRGTSSDFAPIQKIRDMARLRRDYERLRAAHEATLAVGTEQRPERIARQILDTAFTLLPAERGVVLLFEPSSTRILARVARLRSGGPDDKVEVSQTVLQEVVAAGKGIIAQDVTEDERLRKVQSLFSVGMRSLMCVPLMHEGKAHGVMQLDCSHATHAFHDEDLELFSMIASAAALSLANLRLRGSLDDVRETERLRLLRVLDLLPMGVALVQPDGQIHAKNGAADRYLHGLARYDGDRLMQVGDYTLAQLLDSGETEPIEIEIDEQVFSTYCSRGGQGTEQEAVLVVEDVTARRLEEQRRSRADRLAIVGQMASGIAHDFNNLMTVVNEGADFLQEATSEPECIEEAEAVSEAGRRATRLVRQLLTFCRRDPVRREPLDLSECVSGMADLLGRALGRDHELQLDLQPNLPPIVMDRGHIDQLVMNLVVNGRDAMQTPGRLLVRTRTIGVPPRGPPEPDAQVLLEVQDTGCGMTEEVTRRIFEPFYTTKPVGSGTGLGLATVHGIVEGMHGKITVDSEVDRGTKFEISFPLTKASTSTRDLSFQPESNVG